MFNQLVKKQDNKKFKKQLSLETREFIFDILVIICLVIFSIIISPKVLQNDTFYTIKCGEYIFNNGIFNLTTDEFSWMDLPYTFPHWLYDLMIYLIYSKLGLDGIYISTIFFTVILGLSLYNLSLITSKNRVVSAVALFGILWILKPYIAARAQLVTFILFTLEILCVEQILETNKKIYGVFLLVIALLIVQLHCAVFPMFFVFLLPYIAEYLLIVISSMNLDEEFFKGICKLIVKFSKKEEIKKKYSSKISRIEQNIKIRNLKREKMQANPYKIEVKRNNAAIYIYIIAIIAVFLGFLNPAGTGAYTYTFKIYQGNTTSSINEHLPLTLIDSTDFAIALIIILAILIFTDAKIKLRDLFMFLGVTFLSFFSRRQISIFAIMCMPIIVKLIAFLFEKYDSKTCEKLLRKMTSIVGIIVIIAGFCYFGNKDFKQKQNEEYIDKSDYPVEAAEWIKNNLDLENLRLYNEYNYGSYLLYQGIPVFIDSRCDLYTPEFNSNYDSEFSGKDIFSDALDVPSLARGYEDIFEDYGINHVILYENAKLCLLLDEDENYQELYKDDHFKIYERLNAN